MSVGERITGATPPGAAGVAGGSADEVRLVRLPLLADPVSAPAVDLPSAGAALRTLSETFTASATGAAELDVGLGLPPGRDGSGSGIRLRYSTALGAGVLGLGWELTIPSVRLRTESGVPRYLGDDELLFGQARIVPRVTADAAAPGPTTREIGADAFLIEEFLPRVEGAHTRIERWTNLTDAGDVRWRAISATNGTTWFGFDAASRVFDPHDERRIAEWLPSTSYDDRGNLVEYTYRAEDSRSVDATAACEATRSPEDRTARRYLTRVSWANRTPYRPHWEQGVAPASRPADFCFHLVVDYGDHDPHDPRLEPDRPWPVRPDPHSARRGGFEVRTYRRCHSLLVFHQFPELGGGPVLVQRTDLAYTEGASGTSLLTGATRTAVDTSGQTASLPEVRFDYINPEQGVAHAVGPEQSVGSPSGLASATYELADLDGTGAPGILHRGREAWLYKRNLAPLSASGEAAFAAPVALAHQPTGAAQDIMGRAALVDVDGDGLPDLLNLTGAAPGFAPRSWRDGRGSWGAFVAFAEAPTGLRQSSGVMLADLTGDGLVDLVELDGIRAHWRPGRRERGFGPPRPLDLVGGEPASLSLGAVPDRALLLADMDGDGLVDLVEVTRGRVRYRPNLGHGRFGRWVLMDAGPEMGPADEFDAREVLLVDTDGTGPCDLLYLGLRTPLLFRNLSGNRCGGAEELNGLPARSQLTRVAVADVFGRGTAAVLWSTAAPTPDARPMHVLDLAAAGKPHLLRSVDNGTGRTTTVEYIPSTAFALADDLAGEPWPDRLPFPVQCVSRWVVEDHVRGSRFVTERSYHLGRYDGDEREFTGFGRVDTRDTERHAVAPEDLPPVLVRTWYHTGGVLAEGAATLHVARAQYADVRAPVVPEPELPTSADAADLVDAARALAGLQLRTEVSAEEDGVPGAPYSVVESTVRVRRLQERAHGRPGAFQVDPVASLTYATEGELDDPRVTQQLVLEVDGLGRVLSDATVVHPRRRVDPGAPETVRTRQSVGTVTVTHTDYTGDLDEPDVHRIGMGWRARAEELTGVDIPAGVAVTAGDVTTVMTAATELEPHEVDGPTPGLRLLGRSEVRFRGSNLPVVLPPGQMASHGLVHSGYTLAMTAAMAADLLANQPGTPAEPVDEAALAEAGLVHLDADPGWWVPSGTWTYPADATTRFLQPDGGIDALGSRFSVERIHDLLVVATRNARGHEARVDYDLHALAPRLTTDVNGNRTEVLRDPLGVVVRSAVMGPVGSVDGDTLADPTVRCEYDLSRWRSSGLPTVMRVLSREQHGAVNTRWQERRIYLDGAGTPLAVKEEAAPGVALHWDPVAAAVVEVDTAGATRWRASGRVDLNNKGLPIRTWDPYFTDDPEFDHAGLLIRRGVSDVPTYDPLGRLVRVEHPDGTFALLERTPWRLTAHDEVDTVRDSGWYVERGSPDPAGPEPADLSSQAAWQSARNAATPRVTHLDPLGRVVCVVSDNGGADVRTSVSQSDVIGVTARTSDTRGRVVHRRRSDLSGLLVRVSTAERGETLVLSDVLGAPRHSLDITGRHFTVDYDDLHRPVKMAVDEGGNPSVLTWVRFGDDDPVAAPSGSVGRLWQLYDESGRLELEGYSFEGAPLGAKRRYAPVSDDLPDWATLAVAADPDAVADTLLEDEEWRTTSHQDALGRPLEVGLPEGTVLTADYDIGNNVTEVAMRLGAEPAVVVLAGQEFDAWGRCTSRRLGNGVVTTYRHGELSRRLEEVRTVPNAGPVLQHLTYTHDAAGNVTAADDAAQQTVFFSNAVVTPLRTFVYDALGQLVRATGRELAGLDLPTSADVRTSALPHVNDAQAVRRYVEDYAYDDLGNLREVRHSANGGGWRQRHRFAFEDDPGDLTNRLVATNAPGDADGVFSAKLGYDAMGNLSSLPQVAQLGWDALGCLARADLGGGGVARYSHAAGGRTRKVVTRGNLVKETLYLGVAEIRRERLAGQVRQEIRTVHVPGDGGRLARADRLTVDDGSPVVRPPVLRWLHHDHLGSTAASTNTDGRVVSYEEYRPYGATSYRSSVPGENLSLATYRFLSRERDEETGFCQLGQRSYLPWLGRFASPDPAGFVDGLNLYRYGHNNPATLADPGGTQPRYKLARKQHFTGKETFDQLRQSSQGVKDAEWDPAVTRDNFRQYYMKGDEPGGAGGVWVVLRQRAKEPDKQPTSDQPPDPDADVGTGNDLTAGGDTPGATGEGDKGTSDKTGSSTSVDPGPGGEEKDKEDPARSGGQGAVGTWDSSERTKYMEKNKVRSQAAQDAIEVAKKEGDVAKAMKIAEDVSEARAAGRTASQARLSPGGRDLSQAIDTGQDFADSVTKYKGRLPGVESGAKIPAADEAELARRIAVGAGESRASMRYLAKGGRILGPVALAYGVYTGVAAVMDAPPGLKGRVASREAGAFAGGAIGASVGMSAGVAAAGFISGLLVGLGIISGPIGWLAIGLGLLGAVAVGWWWSKRGGQIGQAAYDAAAD